MGAQEQKNASTISRGGAADRADRGGNRGLAPYVASLTPPRQDTYSRPESVKQPVTIEIAGARYRMSSDADPEHLQRLAEVINDRIAELGSKAMRSASTAQLLAVVALGLAEDLEVSESRRLTLEAQTRRVITDAIARIDHRLAADSASAAADEEDSGPTP